MTGTLELTVLFIPGEFSDSNRQHEHDVKAVFQFGVDNDVDLYAGTEANPSSRNNTQQLLHDIGKQHGLDVRTNDNTDCWVGVDRRFGSFVGYGFMPVVPGHPGPASGGGHGPRGLMHGQVQPHDQAYGGDVHVGSVHLVTDGTDPHTLRGHQNTLITHETGQWASRVGRGRDIAILTGDMNTDDQHRDVWRGAPLVTCWDDLKKWPTTHPGPHGGGPTLDVIARYERDHRVTCTKARAITDDELRLNFDHYSVLATFAVRPIRA